MKGLELPINIIIIIVIVLVVLLAVIAMFFGGINPASGSTSLQSATTATCLRVNPMYCDYTKVDYNGDQFKFLAARMPVYDFDANNDGILNTHNPELDEPGWGSKENEDNLEMLCINYYGCKKGGAWNNDASWAAWYICCLKNVCGCP